MEPKVRRDSTPEVADFIRKFLATHGPSRSRDMRKAAPAHIAPRVYSRLASLMEYEGLHRVQDGLQKGRPVYLFALKDQELVVKANPNAANFRGAANLLAMQLTCKLRLDLRNDRTIEMAA